MKNEEEKSALEVFGCRQALGTVPLVLCDSIDGATSFVEILVESLAWREQRVRVRYLDIICLLKNPQRTN